jgi:putative redox protein
MQENVRFENSRGEQLSGVLHTPDTAHVAACAVFAHCFTCTKNIKAAVNISEALAGEGLAVLRFDFTGLGQSEGDFADTHFSSNVQDLVDAAVFMAGRFEPPAILVGHSLGGTAVLAAAHQLESVKAVATVGSPADAEHVLHLLDDDIEAIEQQGEAQVSLAGRPFRIRRDFVDDVRSQSVRDGIRSLRRALLVMHSPVDELVPIEQASQIYASALHPKSFVSLDKADHLLSAERDSRYVGQLLAAWATRYIDFEEHLPEMAPHVKDAVVIRGEPQDIFLSAVNANGHRLLADEPEHYGGTDFGPNPYDFLSGGRGASSTHSRAGL